jgi:glycosyltransferase involved in cell wall biosynthesis
MEHALLTHAAHVVPNSQATVHMLQEAYGLALCPDQYRVIPHGIEPVAEDQVRPFNLTRPPDVLTVLYVGRLEKRKGILDLFAAIPLVLARLPNVRFLIAGNDNSASDGFLARHGQTYAAHFAEEYRACAAQVEFLGPVSEEKLQQLYQTCDLFVAPSLYESFGLIYLEAMNYAKPVIGGRAGGIPEVIDEGVTGLLAEPEAPDSLAHALVALLQSPQKLHDWGLAGRQR